MAQADDPGPRPGPGMRPWEKQAWAFLLKHLAAGVAGSVVASTGILVLDVGRLWSLISTSDEPVAALFLLYFSLAVLFGSVAMGIGIMSQGEDPN